MAGSLADLLVLETGLIEGGKNGVREIKVSPLPK
jgi:hypothetical protein